jgi:hypothetical protein
MHGPRDDEALQGLDGYEQMVNTCAENAKAYWRLWGPLGEPMIRVVDAHRAAHTGRRGNPQRAPDAPARGDQHVG